MSKLGRKMKRLSKDESWFEEIWEEFLDKIWYDPKYWIKARYKMLCRMIYWGWHMRWNWDFDALTIYDMLYRKLDRLYKEMRDNSHLDWNSDENNRRMRELREARELARRLMNNDYDMKAFYEVEERYGELKTWSEYLTNGLYRYHSEWPNDKEARKFYRRRDKHWLRVHKLHKNRFFELLNRNIEQWWD